VLGIVVPRSSAGALRGWTGGAVGRAGVVPLARARAVSCEGDAIALALRQTPIVTTKPVAVLAPTDRAVAIQPPLACAVSSPAGRVLDRRTVVPPGSM
jgi:hypothetical protein